MYEVSADGDLSLTTVNYNLLALYLKPSPLQYCEQPGGLSCGSSHVAGSLMR